MIDPLHDPDSAPDIFAVGEYTCPECGTGVHIQASWPCSVVRTCCGLVVEIVNVSMSS